MDPLKSAGLRRLLLVLLGVWVLLAPGVAAAKSRTKSAGQSRSRGGGRGGGHRDRGQPWSSNASRGRNPEKSLSEYSREIARKVARARTPDEFLRVFFPADSIKARWTTMVNESVQNAWRAGRTETDAVDSDRPTFTDTMAEDVRSRLGKQAAGVWCREPKPVLVDMYEELGIDRGTENLFPPCMNVRRCAGSGCCGDDLHQCMANETTRTNVTGEFMVTAKGADGQVKSVHYIRHLMAEDTECSCRKLQRSCSPEPCTDAKLFNAATCRCECRRRCPKPFRLNETTCDCSCHDNDGLCNKIKRSKRKMSLPECKCVLDGECSQPSCRKGYQFQPPKCQCIQSYGYLSKRDRNRDRDRDRNRGPSHSNGREQGRGQDRQRTVPSAKSGRTIYGPGQPAAALSPSSSDAVDDDDDDDNGDSSASAQLPFVSEPGGPDPGDGASAMVGEDLLVVWESEASPAEDCSSDGPSCQQQQQPDGSAQGFGSGGGGGD